MKNSSVYSIALASVLVLSLVDVEARGLGAGGGAQHQQAAHSGARAGGGVAHSAPSMSRPSRMQAQTQHSRQVNRPAQVQTQSQHLPIRSKFPVASERTNKLPISGIHPGTPPSGTTRPTHGQVQHFLNLPKAAEGAKPGRGIIGPAVGGAAAALALQNLAKPGGGDAHRAGGDTPISRIEESVRRGSEGAHGAGGDTARADRPGMGDHRRGEHAQVAQQIRNNYRQQNLFDSRWRENHRNLANDHWHNRVWRNHDWNYWWQPATWAIAAGWFPWGWSSPVAYDFGDNVLYDNNIVYMNGQQVATAGEYYQQASQLASTAKDDTADTTEWLPLGVFALSRGDTGASNTVLQLAVNKNGVISGTYYNTDTDIARPIKGMVDKKTQRAAWTFADGKDTNFVMEAGINNLTQDQTEALVHFGKDMTQQWLMVRLQEPPAQKTKKGDSEAR
jgi:hypothetical protein